jgi:hypothetical protein
VDEAMLLGCKTELNLNNKQKTLAAQHAGVMGFSGLPASPGEQTKTSHGHRFAQALGSRGKEGQPLVKFPNAPRNRLCGT